MLIFTDIDQLTVTEIIQVADVVYKHFKDTPLKFNVITLKVSILDLKTFLVATMLTTLPGPDQVRVRCLA